MNISKLVTDLPAEASAVGAFVTGVDKLVTDAKTAGLTSVAISDIEALVPEGEAVIEDTKAVVTDL